MNNNYFIILKKLSKAFLLLMAFCLHSVVSISQNFTITPSTPGVSNCIPFGQTTYGFQGFIYRNIPAFNLNPGDKIRFDLGNLNDIDVRRNIYFAAANINPGPWTGSSQNVSPVSWVQVVPESQTPLNSLGNTTVGDFELTYTATNSFSFAGGGFFIGFGATPPGTYVDAGCEQVGVNTTSSDASGYFYKRFYNLTHLQTGVLDGYGDNGSISGFRIEANTASALHFDGVDDYVAINSPFYTFNKEITVEYWIKPSSFLPFGSIIGQATSGTDNMSTNVWLMHPEATGTSLKFLVNDAGTWRDAGLITPAVGVWSHIVGVASATSTKIYLNGVLMSTGPGISTGIVNNSSSVIHIGKDVRHNSGRFGNFTIDEVKIYSRALCQAEILNNKNCELNMGASQTGLQEYYRFNQGSTILNNSAITTLNDQSGNTRNGSLNSFALVGTTSNWVAPGGSITGTCNTYTPSIAAISGSSSVCMGSTLSLSNTTSGGVWSSSNTGVATISAATGLVTPVSTGTTTISYTTDCGAVTKAITVNGLPAVAVSPFASTICAGSSVTITASTSNNLVAYYRFDETSGNTVTDISGNNLTGTFVNSPSRISSGAGISGAGNAITLNNPNYINIPDNAVFNTMQNKLTIEAWIYQTDAGDNTIIDRGDYNFLFMARPNGQTGLGFYNNGGGWTYSAGDIPVGVWSHVAVTWDGSTNTIKFYLNGNLLSTHNRGTSLYFGSGGPVNIGRQSPYTCACNIMTGSIDELRLWSTTRTQAEIQGAMGVTISPVVATSFSWSPASGLNTTTGSTVIASPTSTTTYSVTGTSAAGCVKTNNYSTVTVNAVPTTTASNTGPFCVRDTIKLFSSTPGASYSWTGPNGFTSTQQHPVILNAIPANAGTYTVNITLNGCTGTSTTNVVVNPLPTISASSNSPICSGQTLNLNATGGVAYYWSGPNGFNPGGTSASTSIASSTTDATGHYVVKVQGANGCRDTASTDVIVNLTPVATITTNGPTTFCGTGSVSLQANVASTYSYQWRNNGVDIPTATSSMYTATSTGNYSVIITSTANGCVSAESNSIGVTIITGLDTDGDGLPNACDADDDNDGITDAAECNQSNFFWSNPPSVSGNTATGTINGISYTYTSSTPIFTTTNLYSHGTFPSTYGVPNANPTIQNIAINTNTLTFASPMTNPVLVFASIGHGSLSVPISFSAPIQIVWSHNVVLNSTTQITGTEGYAIIRMMGTFSSITFNYQTAENYCNFAFGADFQNCGDKDNDGTADYLDIDSDNDGCIDAIEGSMSFSVSQTNSGRLTGTIDANGIPSISNGGQGVGTSNTYIANCFCQPGLDENKPNAITQNIVVSLDGNGNATINESQVNNGSTDDCGIASMVLSNTNFNCSNLGANTVTLSVTDNQGNVDIETATVTIQDITPPFFTSSFSILTPVNGSGEVAATGPSGAVVNYITPSASDNCPPATVVSVPASGSVFPIGNTLVTVTATDHVGLTTTNNYTIVVSGLAPSISCPANITVNNAPNQCGANVNFTATETTGIPASTITYSPASGSMFPVGTTTVTATATNPVGTSVCTFTVTVLDVTAPTITCNSNITVNTDAAQCNANVTIPSPLTSDNCTLSPSSILPPFNPNDNRIALWIDATKFSTGNGSSLSGIIDDASINNRTLTTNATYDASGFNGRPAVRYNNNQTATNTGFSTNANTYIFTTVQVIAPSNNWASVFYHWNRDGGLTIEQNPLSPNGAPAGTAQYHFQTGNDNANVEQNITYGTTYIMAAKITGGNVRTFSLYKDNGGSLQLVGTSSNSSFTLPNAVGQLFLGRSDAGEYTNMRMGEFLYIQGSLPASESSIVDYLHAKWFGTVSTTLTNNITNTANASGIYPKGTTTITWTAKDAAGNTSTCNQTVTVIDNIAPTIICPPNINTIATSATGAIVSYATPSVADNCSATLTRTGGLASGSTFPIGTTTVTYLATDPAGLTTTCSFTVEVIGLPPVIVCPPDITVNNTPNLCGANVNFNAIETTGIPASTITYSIAPGSNFAVGTTTVTATATNPVGTSSCTFTVTVIDNQVPNVATNNVTVQLDASGNGSVTAAQINNGSTDNCEIASVTISPSTFNCSNIGANTVTLTVTDIHNNVATANATVTVKDMVAPVALAQNVTIYLDASGNGSTNANAVNNGSTDACGIATMALSKTNFNCSNIGQNNVTLTVTDINGNISTATAIVTVLDQIAPVITCPVNVNTTTDANQCGAVVNFALPTATDNCSGGSANPIVNGSFENNFNGWTIASNTCGIWVIGNAGQTLNANQTIFNYGTGSNSQVTYPQGLPLTFNPTDGTKMAAFFQNCGATHRLYQDVTLPSGNVNLKFDLSYRNFAANFSSSQYTAVEIRNPITNALLQTLFKTNTGDPQSIPFTSFSYNLSAYAGQTVRIQLVDAVINSNPLNVFIDNVKVTGGISIVQTAGISSGNSFPVGTTTNTFVATDSSGNSSTCNFTINVTDNQPPVVICPPNINVYATSAAGAMVNYPTPTASDNCSIASINLISGPVSGSTFPIGTTNVTYNTIDINGNISVCTFTVTVTGLPPVIVCPPNITVNNTTNQCGANVNYNATETTGIPASTITYSIAPGSNFEVGTATVTATATNAVGSSTCSFTVTVLDNQLPNVLTNNVTVQLDASGNGSITASQINNGSTDNCGIASVTVSPSTFSCSNVGANTVTLTVTDIHNNVSTATAVVTVEDNIAPVAIAQNVTVQLDATGNGSTTATAVNNGSSDACGIASMVLSKTDFNCSNVGPNEVTLTITDVNNNVSTATAIVTVQDNIAPLVLTQNITIQLDANGSASITPSQINNGSSDNCAIQQIVLDNTNFNCSNVGSNTVTLSVMDVNGNVSSADATVTVQDLIPATVVTQNITIQLDATGNAAIVPSQINNGSSDNCSIATYAVSPNTFNCGNVGANTVTLTITDVNGNVSSADAVVTVQDMVAAVVVTQDITIQLDAAGNASITPSQINNGSSDACGIQSIALDKTTFNCSNVGSNIVTLTVTDVNNNVSSATATVTVQDVTQPVAIGQDITVQLDNTGNTSITASQINNGSNDACGIASISVSPNTFTCANVGSNQVTLTVTDVNANVSTVTATVTVQDLVAPVVITQPFTIQLGSDASVTITPANVNNGSSDACGIASMSVYPNTFTCSNIGSNTVTLTVTDVNGNVASSTAVVTVIGHGITNANGVIFINQSNVVKWNNVPLTTNGQSGTIPVASSYNATTVNLSAKGGNIYATNCDGIGVTGGYVSQGCNNTTDFKNRTINKDQSFKMSLSNANLGIYKLVFTTGYTGRVKVTAKRNGKSVVSFTKLMTANDFDTFDFTASCALKGICVVDEVEFSLAENKHCGQCGKHHRWRGKGNGHDHHYGDYRDGDDHDEDRDDDENDYDDESSCSNNCGISVKFPILFVQEKESCGLSTASECGTPEQVGRITGLSGTLSVSAYTGNTSGSNSDGNFTTGNPNTTNYAKRLLVGYDYKGRPAAWEVSAKCDIRSIRQGRYSNKPQLPLGNSCNNYRFTVTGVDANGQYIYGTRKQINNNTVVNIRWRVTEFYQRVWILSYEVTGSNMGKGESEIIETTTDLKGADAHIYPNPSFGEFNVSIDTHSDELVDVMVMDGLGREVIQLTNQSPGVPVVITNEMLPAAGIYFVSVKQGNFNKVIKITKVN